MALLGFSLRQLEYFVAAAEAGSISRAAARVHLSQPALSQAITELERAMGARLCVRSKATGVTLTPAGHFVLDQARTVLREARALQACGGPQPSLSGRLAVGCYTSLAPATLPALLSGFADLHPDLEIDFVEGTQPEIQERIRTGRLDLGILYQMQLDPNLVRRPIAEVRPHILLPADHSLAGEDAVSLAALQSEPMVLLDSPPSAENTLMICQSLRLVPWVRHRPTSFEMARALVARGLGYAVMMQRQANRYSYEGLPLAVKEIAEPVSAQQICVVWARGTRLPRAAHAFVEHCVGHYPAPHRVRFEPDGTARPDPR